MVAAEVVVVPLAVEVVVVDEAVELVVDVVAEVVVAVPTS